jgi:iron(III) transport system permease protein
MSAPSLFRFRSISLAPISLLISAIIALPIFFIVISLFSDAGSSWAHIRETVLTEYLINTALLMLQVAAYTTLIGVSTAWLTATTEFPGRRIFTWALMLPLAAPAYIVAYVYTDLLEYGGPLQTAIRSTSLFAGQAVSFPEIRSLHGAALVISLVLYPYVYMLARIAFIKRSATLFDAARTLGATSSRAFFSIALPAARPAIIGGLSLVLMETLADFGVVDYFGIPTFSTGIFRSWFALGDQVAASKLAAVMFLFVVTLVVLEKSQRGRGEQKAQAKDGRFKRIKLKRSLSVLAVTICLMPIALGCLVPIAVLVVFAVATGDPLFGETFIALVGNSVFVSGLAATIATCLAMFLSYSVQRSASRINLTAVQIATLGYAFPGVMLAVGLLSPISKIDIFLADFFSNQLDWQTGLILTGTTFTLVYAYIIRFLTVAFNSTSSGLNQVPVIFEQVSRSNGVSGWRMIQKVHLPLIKPSILTALILVFVDTMRELPATLLLRPFNFETLATRVYRLASDERLAEASTAAIMIVAIGLIPVLFLNRLANKSASS